VPIVLPIQTRFAPRAQASICSVCAVLTIRRSDRGRSYLQARLVHSGERLLGLRRWAVRDRSRGVGAPAVHSIAITTTSSPENIVSALGYFGWRPYLF
jgi:hypothetical protein